MIFLGGIQDVQYKKAKVIPRSSSVRAKELALLRKENTVGGADELRLVL